MQAFVKVAETRSFSLAARQLRKTGPCHQLTHGSYFPRASGRMPKAQAYAQFAGNIFANSQPVS